MLAEPFLKGLVEAFDFALGLWGGRGGRSFWVIPKTVSKYSKAFLPSPKRAV